MGEEDNVDLVKICRAKRAGLVALSADIRCHEVWS